LRDGALSFGDYRVGDFAEIDPAAQSLILIDVAIFDPYLSS